MDLHEANRLVGVISTLKRRMRRNPLVRTRSLMEEVIAELQADLTTESGISIEDRSLGLSETDVLRKQIADLQAELTLQTNIANAYHAQIAGALAALAAPADADLAGMAHARMIQIQDAEADTRAILEMLSNMVRALTAKDSGRRPIEWIEHLLDECDVLDGISAEAQRGAYHVRQAIKQIKSLITQIENSAALAKLSVQNFLRR